MLFTHDHVSSAILPPQGVLLVFLIGSLVTTCLQAQFEVLEDITFRQGTARTRGKLDYPEPEAKFGNLTGVPVLEKLMRYSPIEDIDRVERCAKLFIIAENEELFDNADHAILAHKRAKGVKKLAVLKGIKHYGVYREKRREAQRLAIDWFNQHLKR